MKPSASSLLLKMNDESSGTMKSYPLLVQKFGGTSVGTAERMVSVSNIVRSSLKTCRVIVVLSAMSSYKKAEGTTSRLLEAASEVLKANSSAYNDIIDLVEREHVKAAEDAISDHAFRLPVVAQVKTECQKLRSFLSAAEIIDEVSPRTRDVIISAGEKLSAIIFTALLQSKGVKAVYINMDKIVSKTFDLKDLDQSFYDYLADAFADKLQQAGCIAGAHVSLSEDDEMVVPIVTGFFGPVPGSILKTIGRGYTDLTAALLAVGMKAHELQIWKEVDGIFTADPRKATKARLLASISPEEAAELTYYGSEVIHPFTMEQVIRASIPIRIKNAFNPFGHGTVILPTGLCEADHPAHGPTKTPDLDMEPGSPSSLDSIKGSSPKHPTAVTIKDNVTVLNVHSNKKSVSHGFFAHIFGTLDQYGIVVDLISTSQVHVSMAVNPNVTTEVLGKAIKDLSKFGTVDVIKNLAILSLVGSQMRHLVGMASQMFAVLAQNKVNIEMISQGASEINISCVIEQAKANLALCAVHDACILKCLDDAGES